MKIITTIITTTFVLFASSFHLSTADVLKTYTVISNEKNTPTILYREPTIHSEALGILPVGSKGLVALEKPRKYAGKRWQKIVWKDQRGWVLFKYLKYDQDTSKKMNEKACHINNLKSCL